MDGVLYISLLVISFFLGLFVQYHMLKKGDSFMSSLRFYIFYFLPSLLNFLLLYFSNDLVATYSYYTTLFIFICIVIMTIIYYRVAILNKKYEKYDKILGFILMLPFLIVMAMGMRFLLLNTEMNNNNVNLVNLKTLDDSIIKVKNNFNSIGNVIQNESKNIDKLFVSIKKEIEEKNLELIKIKQREEKLLEKIEYYQELASLSEKQVIAVNKALNKDKNIDLMVSFLVGFLASLFVSFFITLPKISRFFQPKIEER